MPYLGPGNGIVLAAISVFAYNLSSGRANAHGFGQRYDLPIPLDLYIWGAAAVVGLSFVISALFMRVSGQGPQYRRIELTKFAIIRVLTHPAIVESLKTLVVAFFLVVVSAGLIGSPHPLENIAPIAIWVIWWVGMAFVSALIGNL